MKRIRINISNPCDEDWDKMHPVKGGRFCDLCSKKVTDFTGMTDKEIIRYLERNKGPICGRVLISQTQREINHEEEPLRWFFPVSGIAASLLLFSPSAAANIKAPVEINRPIKFIKSPSPYKTDKDSTYRIHGVVQSKNGTPIYNALIKIDGEPIAKTDFSGTFDVHLDKNSLKESIRVEFSCNEQGYVPESRQLNRKELPLFLTIQLKTDCTVKDAVIVKARKADETTMVGRMEDTEIQGAFMYDVVSEPVEQVHKPRRFLGRLFHRKGPYR